MGVFLDEVIFVCYIFFHVVFTFDTREGRLSFQELATKYGHPPEEYQVTTEDGYILTMFRLPGNSNIPVLLQHGTLDSSATWILRGNDSLGITLANANYDVWMSNFRGNMYSRKHKHLDPDKDSAFWDIDLDHFGVFDLSAIIDFILQVTGAKKLNAIGHSAGNTVFYVLGSVRPQYNNKVNVLIALAPIAYFHNSHKPVVWLGKNAEAINEILLAFNIHELFGEKILQRKLVKLICSQPDIGYEICMNGVLFPLVGFDKQEISREFSQELFGYFPAGFPRKTLLHYSQILKRRSFGPFDYGNDNEKFYNRTRPPTYNLGAVSMKIVLIAGQNDKLAPLKNVNLLRKSLPNVIQYIVLSRKLFNHVDFTWVIFAIDQRGDRLNFTQLAGLLGLPVEEYNVVTEDGYILGVQRIPGQLKPPLVFVHGIELAADSWLLRGHSSLPIVLTKMKHDLWFANVRGNIYSRRHVSLNPDTDNEFWEFSFHEHGYYDLASTIDTILNKTNSSQINAISFSQGTTMFTVLTSTRPEYNDKINLSIYLAPIAFLNKVQTPMLYAIAFSPELNTLMKKLGMNEFFGYNNSLTVALRKLCTQPKLSYAACAYGYAFPIAGYDPEQLEPPFYRISNYYFPVGSSRKNMIHFGQVGRTGIFGRYDYGPLKNKALYNSSIPPKYNLTRVRSPVVMMVGRRDKLATLTDAETLRKQLPNVKQFVVLPRIEANHLDFIWGRTMSNYLYPYILSALGF